MMTESFLSFLTANLVVFGIVILTVLLVDALHQILWAMKERSNDDDRD